MSSPHWTKFVKIHACEVTRNIVFTAKAHHRHTSFSVFDPKLMIWYGLNLPGQPEMISSLEYLSITKVSWDLKLGHQFIRVLGDQKPKN